MTRHHLPIHVTTVVFLLGVQSAYSQQTKTAIAKSSTSIICWHQQKIPFVEWNKDEDGFRIDRLFRAYEYSIPKDSWSASKEHRHYLRYTAKLRITLRYTEGQVTKSAKVPVEFVIETDDGISRKTLDFGSVVDLMKDWRDAGGANYNGDIVRILRGLNFFLDASNRWLLVPVGGVGEYADPSWNSFVFDTRRGEVHRIEGVFVPRNKDPFEYPKGTLFSALMGNPAVLGFMFHGVRWKNTREDQPVHVYRDWKVYPRYGEIRRTTTGYYRIGNDPWRIGATSATLKNGDVLRFRSQNQQVSSLDRFSAAGKKIQTYGEATTMELGYPTLHSSPSNKYHIVIGVNNSNDALLKSDFGLLDENGKVLKEWWTEDKAPEWKVGAPVPVKR